MRLLYLGLNPIQNPKPYKILNSVDLKFHVAYLRKLEETNSGKENLNKSAFDHDLTEGYSHSFLKNYSPFKGNMFGNFHPSILSLVARFDVIVIYGHHTLTFLLAIFWGKLLGKKIILTTDATYIEANDESAGWKLRIKPLLLRFLYNTVSDGVFVPSSASAEFLFSLKVKKDKVTVTPYVVDEDLIVDKSKKTNKHVLRKELGIYESDFLFVFCAKFIARKRPVDAILALSKISDPFVKLIMIGAGPELENIENAIIDYKLHDRVILTGIIKYTDLPAYYTSSDALVFCSDHEPYGLPVNEAMLCGIPVLLSDRIGAGKDLLLEGCTGYSYKCGDVTELADKMKLMIDNRIRTKEMGRNSLLKMESWSSQTNVESQLNYFKQKCWWK